ncbi:unnamed protein product [Paramecium primaurelia]|uniref:Uncharacterized protein n=1 Tax=Paramecium primaurelia TaxID=5886 RepID=A0A8S1JRK5_PARPR|nr:unnamed protein product [Paramecium primaurelia]
MINQFQVHKMIVRTPMDIQNMQLLNTQQNKNNIQATNKIDKAIQECINRSTLQIDVLEQIRARSKDRKSSQKNTTSRTTRRYEEQNQNQLIQNELTKPIKLDFQQEGQENIFRNEQLQRKQSVFQIRQKDLDQMFEETITKSRQITQKFNFIR